ncbi:MAG TPA: RluA family pseudouridine synthase, partial [Candidatus Saccharibacteria bacterium]|nr:RluA family pseudouridine synthase [Candidatus Saccharibacteria bacterium]
RRYTTNNIDGNRPGIVHRLDRATSGVIMGARHNEAAAFLKKQFANRTVKKEYTAIVDGTPKTSKAVIDLPIERNPSKPSTFRVNANGKLATTLYEVVSSNHNQSLVKLFPKTGRTHQLRVHMQYINTPIVGDPLYGHKHKKSERMYLHAHKLSLTIPSGKHVTFTAPAPQGFLQQFEVSDVS